MFLTPDELASHEHQHKGQKMKATIQRQGDVLLVPIEYLPSNATAVKCDGPVVLAFGEVTGHCHQIKDSAKVRMWSAGAERFLQVMEAAVVSHEEHAPLNLAPGVYRLPAQVEYSPAELRRVAD